MYLQDLRGQYDAVFSLGQNCLPAIEMEAHGLRPFAGVLDWMSSDYLSDVNRLIKNRFDGFMELKNLKITGYAGGNLNLRVMDQVNHVESFHDFPTSRNTLKNLNTFPEFKMKLDRRIDRFYEKAATCQNILYIRMLGDFGEVKELQSVLKDIVKNSFRLLVVNYSPDVKEIVELPWQLDQVCTVVLPSHVIWNGESTPYWKTLFQGISVI